jgi:hypothetical protein
MQLASSGNAPEFASLGLVGHGHCMHEHWNVSRHHSLSAFLCKDGNHFMMDVVNGVQQYHVWFAWFEEDVHLDVTADSAIKEFIVKKNWEDCKIGIFSDLVVQNLL